MTVIAVLCSDLHLQHTPPACRAGEPNWYDAMKRVLQELGSLQFVQERKRSRKGAPPWEKLPIILAGDVFDRWDSPPELINFALEYMPEHVYAIPGQHDLPDHNYQDRKKSAYWSLVLAGKMDNLKYCRNGPSHKWDTLQVHAFPWGFDLESRPPAPEPMDLPRVAVVHSYIWVPGHEYLNAPKASHLLSFKERLQGYDVALFGDNHSHFTVNCGECVVWNNGAMIRRRSNETDYKPVVGLLNDDGTITKHELDTSKDVFEPVVKKDKQSDFSEILEELDRLQQTQGSLDFKEVVRLAMNIRKAPHAVRKIILEEMAKDE